MDCEAARSSWYDEHHLENETEEFNAWWLGHYGAPGDYTDHEDDPDEFWTRKAFALQGWLAADSRSHRGIRKIVEFPATLKGANAAETMVASQKAEKKPCERCGDKGFVVKKGFMNLHPCPSCFREEIKQEMRLLLEDPSHALLDVEGAERQLNQLGQLLCWSRPAPKIQCKIEGFRHVYQIAHPTTLRKMTLEEFFAYLDEPV